MSKENSEQVPEWANELVKKIVEVNSLLIEEVKSLQKRQTLIEEKLGKKEPEDNPEEEKVDYARLLENLGL